MTTDKCRHKRCRTPHCPECGEKLTPLIMLLDHVIVRKNSALDFVDKKKKSIESRGDGNKPWRQKELGAAEYRADVWQNYENALVEAIEREGSQNT